MAVDSVLAFWAIALLLIVVPGADWAFTIGAGMRGRSVVPAVTGLVVGYAMVTAVIAAGVGALVAGSPAALTALSILGGLYLMWQGAATALGNPAPLNATTPATRWRTFLKGVGVSGLNPKALMMFLALLPQFTDTRWGWPVTGQIGVLGAIFTLSCAVFYLCLGSAARTLMRQRPNAAATVSRLSGIAMILIGAALLAERLGKL
ncbi:lysine transporter LysE [Rhizocola hellebori]|uniref:Lysine transporter LysE n=1 Tax=Rhizocola hellebori TaxID=1392758 RepID=A0A8J3VM97_9ACTN|nr:LysE family translocator [Rhizocola hellebori]GIH10993.1 lysine transporter LysE [Rhizocola hellebori]